MSDKEIEEGKDKDSEEDTESTSSQPDDKKSGEENTKKEDQSDSESENESDNEQERKPSAVDRKKKMLMKKHRSDVSSDEGFDKFKKDIQERQKKDKEAIENEKALQLQLQHLSELENIEFGEERKKQMIDLSLKPVFPETEIRRVTQIVRAEKMSKSKEATAKETQSKLQLPSHDLIKFAKQPSTAMWLEDYEDKEIVFAATMKRISNGDKKSPMTVAITHQSLYFVDQKQEFLRIPFTDLDSILINYPGGDEDDIIGVKTPTFAVDILLQAPAKKEKDLFIDHAKDAYQFNQESEIPLHFVADAKYYCRTSTDEVKPPPVAVSKDTIITSAKYDSENIALFTKWRILFCKFGSKTIHFSEITQERIPIKLSKRGKKKEKSEKQYLYILTDEGFYVINPSDEKVKRRIGIPSMKKVYVDTKSMDFRFYVLPENGVRSYDQLFTTKKKPQFIESLQAASADLELDYMENVAGDEYPAPPPPKPDPKDKNADRNADKEDDKKFQFNNSLEPSEDYKKKLLQMKDPETARKLLQEALDSKNETKIRNSLKTAAEVDLELDKLYIMCQIELKNIRASQDMVAKWEELFNEGDMFGLRRLIKKAETLKPHSDAFLDTARPKLTFLLNKTVYEQKLKETFNDGQGSLLEMKKILVYGEQCSLADLTKQYREYYDQKEQRAHCKNLLQTPAENEGALRQILAFATSLQLDKSPAFDSSKESLLKLKINSKEKRERLKDIEKEKNLQRAEIRKKIQTAILQKRKNEIENLINSAKDDPELEQIVKTAKESLKQMEEEEKEKRLMDQLALQEQEREREMSEAVARAENEEMDEARKKQEEEAKRAVEEKARAEQEESANKFKFLDEINKDDDADLNEEELKKKQDERARKLKEEQDAAERQKVLLAMKHPFIDQLHEQLLGLLNSLSDSNKIKPTAKPENKNNLFEEVEKKIDAETGKFIVTLKNSFAYTLIKTIGSIITHKTKKIFWIKERTILDIFKGLATKNNDARMTKFISEFEAFDAIQHLATNSSNFSSDLTILFIEYLLDKEVYLEFMNKLLSNSKENDKYILECFDQGSILLSPKNREDFLLECSLLQQYVFRFGFSAPITGTTNDSTSKSVQVTTDLVLASPVGSLKEAIQLLVSHFYEGYSKLKEPLASMGDDSKHPEVLHLVKQTLCPALENVLLNGFNSGILNNYTLWNFIEEGAQKKRTSAVDIGGIGLPPAIDKINLLANEKLKKMKDQNMPVVAITNEEKFRAFVCIALCERQLGDYLQSLMKEEALVASYFTSTSILTKPKIQEKVLTLLQKLSRLPFALSPL